MNSAGNETGSDTGDYMRQALASQGELLGQHESLLRSLVESNRALLDQVSMLTSQVAQLFSNAASPHSQAAASAPAPSASAPVSVVQQTREPHAPVPERYSGDLGTCQAFLTQILLVFDLQPLSYATDRARIAYLVSLLSGTAREWVTSMWERQDPICHSYPAFVREMKKVLDQPVRGKDAGHRLMAIRQGTRSVAEYSIEFRTLAAASGWNDDSLQGAFYAGLHDDIKDELATREETSTLDQTIALATRIDNRIRERRRERHQRTEGPRVPIATRGALPPAPRRPSEPEPMQLGRTQLSAQERQLRQDNNACMYCGKTGHYIASCPSRSGKGPAHR